MKSFLGFFSILVIVGLFFVSITKADEFFPETLPFEVALLYHKMIDTPPNFLDLAKQSPIYINAPALGKEIVLEEQQHRIEMLFYALSKNMPITIVDNFTLEKDDDDDTVFYLKEMNESLNYIYDVDKSSYIVFIRNYDAANKIRNLPLTSLSLARSVVSRQIKVGAEIVLKPAVADVKPFIHKGESMHLILADISLLRLIDNFSGRIIAEYEPIKKPPEPSEMEKFFNEIIREKRNPSWAQNKDKQ